MIVRGAATDYICSSRLTCGAFVALDTVHSAAARIHKNYIKDKSLVTHIPQFLEKLEV